VLAGLVLAVQEHYQDPVDMLRVNLLQIREVAVVAEMQLAEKRLQVLRVLLLSQFLLRSLHPPPTPLLQRVAQLLPCPGQRLRV
jgi:hypothetical protein